MALTGKKARRDGWQNQAERLVLTHTAKAKATVAMAEQMRHRPLWNGASCDLPPRGAKDERELRTSKTNRANEPKPARAKTDGSEKRVTRETATAWIANARKEILTERAAQVAATDKRIVELESKLRSARERLVLRENANRSLQSTLDLMGSENRRLSVRLTESEATIDRAFAQVVQVKRALSVAQDERNKSVAAGDEARFQLAKMETVRTALQVELNRLTNAVSQSNEKRQIEINMLNARLEAMSSRAGTAEKLLADALQSLRALTGGSCSIDRKFADANATRHEAVSKLELLQNLLQEKERQVQELEQERTRLIEAKNTLLKIIKTR